METQVKESSVPAEEKKAVHTEPACPATQADSQKVSAASGVQYGDDEDEEAKTIKLTGTKVKSADEEETLIYIKKTKLYRFRDGKWKERGEGYCKLLRNSDN